MIGCWTPVESGSEMPWRRHPGDHAQRSRRRIGYVLCGAVLLMTIGGCATDDPARRPPGLNAGAAWNATYRTEFRESGELILNNGRFAEPVIAGAATMLTVKLEQVAMGDLDGDGRADLAVVLETNAGGSGVFSHLHALVEHEGLAREAGSVLLGDRIRVQEVRIEDRLITIQLFDRPEGAAFAEPPSLPDTRRFAVRGGELVALATGVPSAPETP